MEQPNTSGHALERIYLLAWKKGGSPSKSAGLPVHCHYFLNRRDVYSEDSGVYPYGLWDKSDEIAGWSELGISGKAMS